MAGLGSCLLCDSGTAAGAAWGAISCDACVAGKYSKKNTTDGPVVCL